MGTKKFVVRVLVACALLLLGTATGEVSVLVCVVLGHAATGLPYAEGAAVARGLGGMLGVVLGATFVVLWWVHTEKA